MYPKSPFTATWLYSLSTAAAEVRKVEEENMEVVEPVMKVVLPVMNVVPVPSSSESAPVKLAVPAITVVPITIIVFLVE